MLASVFSCAPCCADKNSETVIVEAHSADSRIRGCVVKDSDEGTAVGTDAPSSITSSGAPVVPVAARAEDDDHLPAPLPEYFEFDVTVDKGGQKLGLEITPHDGRTLLVGKVKDMDSPLSRWNAQQSSAELRMYRGDRIMAINNTSGDSEAMLEAQRADRLTMRVRRLLEFTATIDTSAGEPLGLEFADAGGVVVSNVQPLPSLAQQFNSRNAADLEIRAGDLVRAVNGADAKDAQSVHLLASNHGQLELQLRRQPPAARELILTLHISADAGGERAEVCCTTMSGEEACSVRASLGEDVRSLRAAISGEMPGQTFQMILPGGQVLQPRNDALLLADVIAA